jgi:hypothetical protein
MFVSKLGLGLEKERGGFWSGGVKEYQSEMELVPFHLAWCGNNSQGISLDCHTIV